MSICECAVLVCSASAPAHCSCAQLSAQCWTQTVSACCVDFALPQAHFYLFTIFEHWTWYSGLVESNLWRSKQQKRRNALSNFIAESKRPELVKLNQWSMMHWNIGTRGEAGGWKLAKVTYLCCFWVAAVLALRKDDFYKCLIADYTLPKYL